MLLRPEYYAQHKCNGVPIRYLDHTKLSYKELMFGMDSILQHMLQTGGDIHGYCAHELFILGQAQGNKFLDRVYVDYDRYIIDKFIDGHSSSFTVGDMLGIAMHFHGGNLLSFHQNSAQMKYRKDRRGKDDQEGGVQLNTSNSLSLG